MSKTYIKLSLEVKARSTWGPDCTIAQIHSQAKEEAVNRIRKLIGEQPDVRLIGDVSIETLISSDDVEGRDNG